jgi:C4-dicarboxylate transporter DctM subunit
VTALGVAPMWFGVFIVLTSEIALITPPGDESLRLAEHPQRERADQHINGVWPYAIMILGFRVFVWYVPEDDLWLPRKIF